MWFGRKVSVTSPVQPSFVAVTDVRMFAGSGSESGACAAIDPSGTKQAWAWEVVVPTVVVVEPTVVPGTDDVTGSVEVDGWLEVVDALWLPLLPHAARSNTAETTNHP